MYGFPILMTVGLGIAFQEPADRAELGGRSSKGRRPRRRRRRSPRPKRPERFKVEVLSADEATAAACGPGRTDVVVGTARSDGRRARSRITLTSSIRRDRKACWRRKAVDDQLQRAAGREGRGRREARGNRRAGRAVHRFSRARAVGHEPDGRRLVGRRVRHGRHARAQAAQAVPGHADEENRFSRWAS